MELRALRYFVATVRHGTVSAAAEQVRVSQPSVSRQLRLLERELGVELFVHESGRLRLNAVGQRFFPLARELVSQADSARQAAVAMASGDLTRLTLAAPSTTLVDIVAPFVSTFGPDDPVPSVLEWSTAHDLTQLLYDTDLVLLPERPPTSLQSRYLATFPIWGYVRHEHPWAGLESLAYEDLAGQAVVVPPTHFKSRQVLQSVATLSKASPSQVIETSNGQIAQALAAARRGTAVVTDDPAFGLERFTIVWNGSVLHVDLYACWRSGHPASELLGAIVSRLRRFCVSRYGASVVDQAKTASS